VRAQLDHPVIDSDGHTLEFQPAVFDFLAQVGGTGMVDRYRKWVEHSSLFAWYALSPQERAERRVVRPPWWGLPMRNTRDRATVVFPRLLHERLDELGIDYTVLYPTWGIMAASAPDPDMRAAACRALNFYAAEVFRPHANRMTAVAVIPMHTPGEAIGALDHAVAELGLKAVVMAGYVARPIPALEREAPAAAPYSAWLDPLALDSAFDYDPVWKRCEELGVCPTFHSGGMGWGSRNSISNYMYNHIGHFAAAGELTAKALFLGGVTRRFPRLRFAFLEGGVAWGCSLYADLLGHWEKRNTRALDALDPASLDREAFQRYFEQYAEARFRSGLDTLQSATGGLTAAVERVKWDEWAACRIEGPEDVRALFVEPFYFGCEADDPTTAWAFDTRVNPLGARLHALFSSDIGHWDVPELARVTADAWELVERGLLTRADFRDFSFANAARFWTALNPGFFRGTAVEAAVERLLAA
jgi:predicted TIM-barrel fold metal-dependent hydrolase